MEWHLFAATCGLPCRQVVPATTTSHAPWLLVFAVAIILIALIGVLWHRHAKLHKKLGRLLIAIVAGAILTLATMAYTSYADSGNSLPLSFAIATYNPPHTFYGAACSNLLPQSNQDSGWPWAYYRDSNTLDGTGCAHPETEYLSPLNLALDLAVLAALTYAVLLGLARLRKPAKPI